MDSPRVWISGVLIGVAAMLAFLPAPASKKQPVEQAPAYLTADQVADRLIGQDPALVLIDVREAEAFQAGSLPGAVSVPPSELLSEGSPSAYLLQEGREIVLFGANTAEAYTAWQQAGVPGLSVLQEGMEGWQRYIIAPAPPASTASGHEWALYSKRLGASQYFTGSKAESSPAAAKAAPLPVAPRKKKSVQGGCS